MNEMAQGHMNELLYYKKDGKTLTFIREDLRGCLMRRDGLERSLLSGYGKRLDVMCYWLTRRDSLEQVTVMFVIKHLHIGQHTMASLSRCRLCPTNGLCLLLFLIMNV